MNATLFVYCEDGEILCLKAFSTPEAALAFAIPYVAEKVGYSLTGDDNVDWDVLNTEIEHPGACWSMVYGAAVE